MKASHIIILVTVAISLFYVQSLASDKYLSNSDNQARCIQEPNAKKPMMRSGIPYQPDPEVIRQGGDTIEDAVLIPSLPFSDEGTTVGYTDDYDEVCPYEGSTSPDVVYSYTSFVGNIILTIDLSRCSDYDTKMYVYENEYTPGEPYACNDDMYSGPCYPAPYLSWLAITVRPGNTYYIVIDGFGGESGNYTIDIGEIYPPLPGCCIDMVGPDDSWTFTTSDIELGPYKVYDNFECPDLYEIYQVQWWGLDLMYGPGWAECTEEIMDFEVAFYEDNNNEPGAVICSYDVSADRNSTGIYYGGIYELIEWSTNLDQPCEINSGWLSIQGISAYGDTCVFLWGNSFEGDQFAYQDQGGQLVPLDYDLSKCLTDIVPPTCDVEMAPDYDPVYVYPGHSFGYTGYLENPNTYPMTVDLWLMVYYPDYGQYGPLRVESGIHLDSGEIISAHLNQHVPVWAPTGEYDYIAYCGYYPGFIMDSASFPFIVLAGSLQTGYNGMLRDNRDDWVADGEWITSGILPGHSSMLECYPNPFNVQTNINFIVREESVVNLSVYNLGGQKVSELYRGTITPGEHVINWDGGGFSSGVYFVRLSVGENAAVRRVVLLK
ncbi:MAG: T9SS type A sorting domain-containing protein [candidate division Zixibacteria bacterium]|nr:T9SS type A sorting domain-containing protein [candidate division Zixibacteria bacterium]